MSFGIDFDLGLNLFRNWLMVMFGIDLGVGSS